MELDEYNPNTEYNEYRSQLCVSSQTQLCENPM